MNLPPRMIFVSIAAMAALGTGTGLATEIRDVCRVKGQEESTIRGLGLVVGLNGTGESGDGPTMRALAPSIPAASLLESATWQGARALGFDADFGTIEPGKRARLLAVAIPRGTTDVEEYLVSGISPEQIRWLES